MQRADLRSPSLPDLSFLFWAYDALRMPTAEYADNIRQVDKVGGREQRYANCAGYLNGLLENMRSSRLHLC